MKHKEIYNSLIMKGITIWNETIIVAIQLEDNLEMKEPSAKSFDATSVKSNNSDTPSIERVVASCLQNMGYNNNRPPQRRDHERELVFCSTCNKNCPTKECPTLCPLYRQ